MSVPSLEDYRRLRLERVAAGQRDAEERAGAAAANQIVNQQALIDWLSFWSMLDRRIWTAIDMAVNEQVAKALAPLEARLAALEQAQGAQSVDTNLPQD
jgi:hypothetical protein